MDQRHFDSLAKALGRWHKPTPGATRAAREFRGGCRGRVGDGRGAGRQAVRASGQSVSSGPAMRERQVRRQVPEHFLSVPGHQGRGMLLLAADCCICEDTASGESYGACFGAQGACEGFIFGEDIICSSG